MNEKQEREMLSRIHKAIDDSYQVATKDGSEEVFLIYSPNRKDFWLTETPDEKSKILYKFDKPSTTRILECANSMEELIEEIEWKASRAKKSASTMLRNAQVMEELLPKLRDVYTTFIQKAKGEKEVLTTVKTA